MTTRVCTHRVPWDDVCELCVLDSMPVPVPRDQLYVPARERDEACADLAQARHEVAQADDQAREAWKEVGYWRTRAALWKRAAKGYRALWYKACECMSERLGHTMAAEARCAALVVMLRRIDHDSVDCPVCDDYEAHADDCELAALLDPHPATGAEFLRAAREAHHDPIEDIGEAIALVEGERPKQ
jgi:hypothetical protein